MASDWHYRRYVSKDQDLYNDLHSNRYEIDQKFREAFKILKKLGAELPDEFSDGEN
jgi:hypothetical protein